MTFAYVDPGRDTTGELNTWGAAHGPLWDAIRAKGRRVEVIAIGAELDMVLRADRCYSFGRRQSLERWSRG